MKHLFLAVAPLSGSTVLQNYLAKCSSVSFLSKDPALIRPTEGQYVYGGDMLSISEIGWPFLPGVVVDLLLDPTKYDWNVIKQSWSDIWVKNNPNATINFQKTPSDIFRVQQIQSIFSNLYWILSVRNPYALVESHIEKMLALRKNPVEHIDKILNHISLSLTYQKQNQAFLGPLAYNMTFEDFAARPDFHAEQLKLFMPELSDLSFHGDMMVKGVVHDGIYNNNAERIEKLRNIPGAMNVVNKHFAQHEDIIKYWGYELIQ